MSAPRKYSDERRERAVRMVEALKEKPGLADDPGSPGSLSWRRRTGSCAERMRSRRARRLSSRRSSTPWTLIAFLDQHKHQFGVEPICTVLTEADAKTAPSTYYAAKSRPPSKRAVGSAHARPASASSIQTAHR